MYQGILIVTYVETLHLEKVEDKSHLFLKSVFLVVSREQESSWKDSKSLRHQL